MAWPWRCWFRGHTWVLMLEEGAIFMECARCGVRTAGWYIGVHPFRFH